MRLLRIGNVLIGTMATFAFCSFSLFGQSLRNRADEALNLAEGDRRRVALFVVGADWARQDPRSAAAWIKSIGGEASNEFVHSGAEDPEDITALTAALVGIDDRSVACKGTVWAWFDADPRAALRWIGTIEDWSTWTHACISVAKLWATKDLGRAVQWARRINSQVLAASIGRWARTDPWAALNEAVALGDVTVLASAMLNADEAVSMEWATSILNGENSAGEAIISDGHDSNAAIEPTLVRQMAKTLALSNPRRALEWVRGLGLDQDVRCLIEGSVAVIWARTDLESGVACALQIADVEERFLALGEIAVEEARQPESRRQALRLALGLPPGGMREWAIALNAGQWAREDPVAAERWFERHIDKTSRDGFVPSLVRPMAKADPARALRLTVSISDLELRDETIYFDVFREVDDVKHVPLLVKMLPTLGNADLRTGAYLQISEIWAESDPPAALTWLAKQPLSTEMASQSKARIGVTWARRDLGRGLEVVRSIENPIARRFGFEGIIRDLVNAEQVEFAIKIGRENSEVLLSHMSVQLAIKDRNRARQIAASIRDDGLRQSTLERVTDRIRSRQVLFEGDF